MSKEMLKDASLHMGRRSFLKMAAIGASFGATSAFASSDSIRPATEAEVKNPYPGSKKVKTICSICSAGCGIIAEVHNGVWVRQEPANDHPISIGGHCCKGADMIDRVRSEKRLRYPMERVNGEWKRISWDEAFTKIGTKMKDLREKYGPDSMMFLGSSKVSGEQSYYIRKFAAMYGTNNIDTIARI